LDRIFIKNLRARGVIGVGDREREKPQDILISVTVLADTRRAGESDDVGDSVDYRALAKKLQDHAETAARYTVEALANDLAKLCLEDPGVQTAIIRVEKPGAVRFSETVGVEVERSREG
jgi:FolB domain-containing protein